MMYPDDPMQPRPIYFLVQRHCGLFGVHAEGMSSQVNYLVDEAASTGKGANCVISYLHHYLAQFGMSEKDRHLHVDNCAGQMTKWSRGAGKAVSSPWRSHQQGQGKATLSLHWLLELTLCSIIIYVMCK